LLLAYVLTRRKGDECFKVLASMVDDDPEDQVAVRTLAEISRTRNKPELALPPFERAIAAGRATPQIHRAHLNNLMALKRWSDALPALDQLEKLANPGPAWRLKWDRGRILAALGRKDEARKFLDEALGMAPAEARSQMEAEIQKLGR
jgi:tetratricopeptide (TPR) repeat protein